MGRGEGGGEGGNVEEGKEREGGKREGEVTTTHFLPVGY